MEFLDRWFNLDLLREPLNWAIVGIAASITLLLFHVVMQAWGAMITGGAPSIGAGPGQVASPVPDVTTVFSQAADYGPGSDLSRWVAGIGPWYDNAESRYAEDGWVSA